MAKVIMSEKQYETKVVITFYMFMFIMMVALQKQVSVVLNCGVIAHGQGDHL